VNKLIFNEIIMRSTLF